MKKDARVATARCNGAVGPNAVVPRLVPQLVRGLGITGRILDLGCGPAAAHVGALREKGLDVYGLDLGRPDLESNRRIEWYSMVYASNVVNVQRTPDELHRLLDDAALMLERGGYFLCNYPGSPRKCAGLGVRDLAKILGEHFPRVERIKDRHNVVFICRTA